MLWVIKQFLQIIQGGNNVKVAQLNLINHSPALVLLLTFLIGCFIYNVLATNFGWVILQTGLNNRELVFAILSNAGIIVGHNYVAGANK